MARKQLSRAAFVEAAKAGTVDPDVVLIKQDVAGDITKADGDPASRQRKFCISTAGVDRDNDIIELAGWRLDNYRKNPQVLFGHDYHSLPIGKATSVYVEGDKLVAIAEFATAEMNPLAEQVLRLIDGGFLRATSVGFRPTKYNINEERRGLDFTECELLEFSVVPVPANPEALIEARAAGVDVSQIEDWAKGVMKALEAKSVEKAPKKAVDSALAAKLSALDSHVDKADEILDSILDSLGIPDDDETPADETDDKSFGARLRALVLEGVKAAAAPCAVCAAIPDAVKATKAGRVLSRANETRLQQAKDHIDSVLAQLARQEEEADPNAPPPGDDGDGDKSAKKDDDTYECCTGGCMNAGVQHCSYEGCSHGMCKDHGGMSAGDGRCQCCMGKAVKADDVLEFDEIMDAVVLEFGDEALRDDQFEIDPVQLRADISRAVAETVSSVVRETTISTLNRLRGRVD